MNDQTNNMLVLISEDDHRTRIHTPLVAIEWPMSDSLNGVSEFVSHDCLKSLRLVWKQKVAVQAILY